MIMKSSKPLVLLLFLAVFATTSKAQTPCTLSLDSVYLDTVLSNCNHLYFKYKYSGGTPSAYKWTYGDGHTCGCYKPHNMYTKNATYSVCGRIQDANGCADSLCLPFTVNCSNPCDLSEIAIYSFDTVSYNCREYEFVAWVSGNAKRKVWLFGDGDSANTSYALHSYYKNGHYNAKMIVQDSIGCGDTANVSFDIMCKANLPCPLQVLSIDTLSLKDCWTKEFTAHCTKQPMNLWWQFGDLSSGFGPINTSHQYHDSGLYQLALYVQDSSGCSDTFYRAVEVNCSKGTAIDFLSLKPYNELHVYPMPVETIMYFEFPITGQLEITDISGKRVFEVDIATETSVNCAHLQPGVYQISIYSEKTIHRSKFLKL